MFLQAGVEITKVDEIHLAEIFKGKGNKTVSVGILDDQKLPLAAVIDGCLNDGLVAPEEHTVFIAINPTITAAETPEFTKPNIPENSPSAVITNIESVKDTEKIISTTLLIRPEKAQPTRSRPPPVAAIPA